MTNQTKYVLVRHSGLGPTAVEHISARPDEVRAVERAGGVVCGDWAEGDFVADAALRYTTNGIAPIGVHGTFSREVAVRGLPVFLPDAFIRTLVRLLAGRAAGVTRAEVLRTAEAIVAEGLPEPDGPARCAASPAPGDLNR